MILAGDVGGTKTELALFDTNRTLVARAHVDSRVHGGLDDLVQAFLDAHPADVDAAAFGVAGPVVANVVKTTNLPWVVSGAALATTLGLASVRVINDLEATAFGLACLGPEDVVVLQRGAPGAVGHQAVVAAGTGLGEAGLYWDGTSHHPYASEGGHASYAPQSPLEVDLLKHLTAEFGHVSWERVLSGPGLYNIYRFLRDTGRYPEGSWLTDSLRRGDPPAVISQAARDRRSDLSVAALDLFAAAYGAEAGNLALKAYATGGVFVAGGIAPRILDTLTNGGFVRAFSAKGRMQSLLEAIPVRVVISDAVNLLGAARVAGLECGPAATT